MWQSLRVLVVLLCTAIVHGRITVLRGKSHGKSPYGNPSVSLAGPGDTASLDEMVLSPAHRGSNGGPGLNWHGNPISKNGMPNLLKIVPSPTAVAVAMPNGPIGPPGSVSGCYFSTTMGMTVCP